MPESPTERKHHPYSPSTLASLEVCPSYVPRQSEKLHERTIAGTIAHAAVESGQDDARLDDDDAAAVAECLLLVVERKNALTMNFSLPPPEVIKEAYLPIDDCKFDDAVATTAGYVDFVLIRADKLHAELLDWKFGRWSVENAEKNLQGIAYALGLFHKIPTLKTITVWFKQPRIGGLTSATFTREQIPDLLLRVEVVVARARAARKADDFANAFATNPNCRFCANLARCPVVAKLALEIGKKYHPLKVPKDISPTGAHSPEETQLCMDLTGVVKEWAEAFRSRTTDRVLRGDAQPPTGFTLSYFTKRKIVDPDKLREVCLKFMSAKEYDALRGHPGFGDLEDVIREKTPRGQKDLAIDQFGAALLEGGAVSQGPKIPYLKAIDTAEKQQTTTN